MHTSALKFRQLYLVVRSTLRQCHRIQEKLDVYH